MSWNVYFRLVHETALPPQALDALARHSRAIHRSLHDYDLVLAISEVDDSTVAHGQVERYYDPDDADVRLLLDALTQLRSVVPAASVEVWDDYGLIGWNGATGRFDFMGQCDVERFTLPAPSDARRKVSDLPDDHEFSPTDWTTRPVSVPDTPVDTDAERTVLLPESPTFRVLSEGWRRRLSIQAWVHNPHGVLVDLQQLRVALRDADGRALDVLEAGIHQPAAELQFVRCRPQVSPGTLIEARQADLWLDYAYEVRQPLARLTTAEMTPRLDDGYRLPVAVEAARVEPGALPVDVAVRVFHGHSYDGFVQVVVELTPRFRQSELSARVRVLVRDEAGMALGAGAESVSFPTDGTAAVVSLSVDLPRSRIGQVRSIELDLEARRDLHVRLGRYALGLPGPA